MLSEIINYSTWKFIVKSRSARKSLSSFVHKIKPKTYQIVKNAVHTWREKEIMKKKEKKVLRWVENMLYYSDCDRMSNMQNCIHEKGKFFPDPHKWSTVLHRCRLVFRSGLQFLEKSIECQSMHSLQINSHLLLHPRLQK